MTVTVTTNHARRVLLDIGDLTEDERALVDYIDRDDYSPRIVRAYGTIYDVYDTQRITVAPRHHPFGFNVPAESPLAEWEGILTDSYWSGIVFRLVEDEYGDERVVVGRMTSD